MKLFDLKTHGKQHTHARAFDMYISSDILYTLQQENQQLKSVLNEVREYIKENVTRDVSYLNDDCIQGEWIIQEPKKLIEILDKVGDK